MSELLPCPFCGAAARIESNRDWHRLYANHADHCVFDTDEASMMTPATDDDLALMVEDWNRRTYPAPTADADHAEDAMDAARFRWMSENWSYAHNTIFFDNFSIGHGTTLRSAIDAAMQASAGQGEGNG